MAMEKFLVFWGGMRKAHWGAPGRNEGQKDNRVGRWWAACQPKPQTRYVQFQHQICLMPLNHVRL
jgi:hypothetical protein